MAVHSSATAATALHAPLLAYLAGVDADVYCLQEVVRAPDARGEWLTYRVSGGSYLQA